jgi:cell division protein FtsB
VTEITHEDLAASHDKLVAVSRELAADSSERKESDRKTRRFTKWLIVLTVIDTLALAFVVMSVFAIRDVQEQSQRRGAAILSTVTENAQTRAEVHQTNAESHCLADLILNPVAREETATAYQACLDRTL